MRVSCGTQHCVLCPLNHRSFVDKADQFNNAISTFLRHWRKSSGPQLVRSNHNNYDSRSADWGGWVSLGTGFRTIKFHYLHHLGSEARRTGCPSFFHTYRDEAYHLKVRGVARRSHAFNFSLTALSRLRRSATLKALTRQLVQGAEHELLYSLF